MAYNDIQFGLVSSLTFTGGKPETSTYSIWLSYFILKDIFKTSKGVNDKIIPLDGTPIKMSQRIDSHLK